MLNLNILASSTGTAKEVAGTGTEIQMPKIVIVKQGTATVDLITDDEIMVPGSIRVNALGNNGAMGRAYTEYNSAGGSAKTAYEWEYNTTTGVLTLPTDTDPDKFVIKYERKSPNAVKITNSADKFPSTVKLTLKALAIDPCEPDVVRSCYIIIPSFQVSPEVSITINTEGTLDYKGDMQIDYCSADKELYTIVMSSDDAE